MIRPARPGDVPALVALVERAYGVYVERIGRRPLPMDDDYARRVDEGGVHVADSGGVAGLIVLTVADDHLLIENVAVDPDRQGTGIGRSLLAFAEQRALAQQLRIVRLYTHVAMTENRALYARLGYEEDERRAEQGFPRVHLSKRLAAR